MSTKLLNKTSTYYLFFAVPVFAICSFILFNWVSSEIQENVDDSLWKESSVLKEKLKSGRGIDTVDVTILLKSPTEITADEERGAIFSDTLIYDLSEKEFLPYRVMKYVINDDKTYYLFSIKKSMVESDDLVESILSPVLILFAILLGGFFYINWYVSKKLWAPFYKTLKQLNEYKINEPSKKFDYSSIQEFSELNSTLNTMTEKIQSDFIHQKQFIENASHEIQTPLAVIKTKIELLIQSSHLNENDMQLIQSVYNAGNKLSSLNKALLLLSKIENDQFKEEEFISFNSLIEKTLLHFEDQLLLKQIRIEKELTHSIRKEMNPVLADILISNIIQNAIRHNITNGFINIQFSNATISVSNTSDTTVSNTKELFHRFTKNEASADSIGLGLSIVKEICDKYHIFVNYSCVEKVHTIELKFQHRI